MWPTRNFIGLDLGRQKNVYLVCIGLACTDEKILLKEALFYGCLPWKGYTRLFDIVKEGLLQRQTAKKNIFTPLRQ